MNSVFCAFDPDDPQPLLRLWLKSWRARGWIPRLILPSELATGLTERQIANRRGGGVLSTPWEINFSRKPRTKHPSKAATDSPKWKSADVVIFPFDATEEEVLHCGRSLDAD